jgi:hypothetical protein
MTKAYLSVVLFAALLYPLVWYGVTPEGFGVVFGYWPMAVSNTVISSLSALSGLFIMKSLMGSKVTVIDGAVMRIGGALVAGVVSAVGIYMFTAVSAGTLPDFGQGWWKLMYITAFVASFLSYWLTNVLVKFVTPP